MIILIYNTDDNWCAFFFCWQQVLRTLYHRSTDSYGVDAWYTSSTTTNECEVHLYHLFGCPLPRYQTAQQRPKWPTIFRRPNRLAQTFLGRPKMAHWAMLWPTCVEFVPCHTAVHHLISGTTGVLQVELRQGGLLWDRDDERQRDGLLKLLL